MPKLKIKKELFKVLFKPKNLLVKFSNAFNSKKSQEMSADSPARNHRMTMEELLQGDEKSQAQLQHVIYKSLSLKDLVETSRDMQEEEGNKMGKQSYKKKCDQESPGKQSSCTASSSLSSFIKKKTRISFSKWKINKMKNGGEDPMRSSDRKSVVGGGGGGEKEEEEGGGGGGGFELCRRRILMGEKCKPLNISGTLRYDESGILLPEEIWIKDS